MYTILGMHVYKKSIETKYLLVRNHENFVLKHSVLGIKFYQLLNMTANLHTNIFHLSKSQLSIAVGVPSANSL